MALREFDRLAGTKSARLTQRLKNRWRGWSLALFAVFLILAFLYRGDGAVYSVGLSRQIQAVEASSDSLSALNELRREKIRKLKNDDRRTIIEEGRRFNLGFPGERVTVVAPEAADAK